MGSSLGVVEQGFSRDEKAYSENPDPSLGNGHDLLPAKEASTRPQSFWRPKTASGTISTLVIRTLLTLCGTWFVWRCIDINIPSLASSSARDRICNRLGPGCAHYPFLGTDVLDARTRPQDLSNDSRVMHEIPQYVLDYAPLVHLYSDEQFWPCDMAEHLFHVTPELNYTPIQGRLQYSNLTNLDRLNEFEKGRHVYLTSNDNVEERPDWLGGQKNIPEDFEGADGDESRKNKFRYRSKGGRSDAPAVLVTVNKGNGIVDAFWFYFYSYNLGNVVFNIRFGNHVGDWEHSLIRFQHGKPKVVFFSEHNFGSAYSYSAVEKIGKRVSCHSSACHIHGLQDLARCLFRHWHPRHVRDLRRSPLRSASRHSSRPNRPRSALGPCLKLSHVHLQPSDRHSSSIQFYAACSHRMVLFRRPLGR